MAFCASALSNVHNDFLIGAPAELKDIPTEFNPQSYKDMIKTFSLELGHRYQMDAKKSIGVGSLSLGYKPYDLHADTSTTNEYRKLLSSFNNANAFERRRLQKPVEEFMESLSKEDPFTALFGKKQLLKQNYHDSLPFNFDDMSKTLLMPVAFCGEDSVKFFDDKVKVYPQKFTELRDDKCLLTIRFEDDVLAERFEVMVSEETLELFLQVSYIPHADYGVRYGIVEKIVFTERKFNDIYYAKREKEIPGQKFSVHIDDFEYEYVMSMDPKKNVHAANNLFATAPTFTDGNRHVFKSDPAITATSYAALLKQLAPLDYVFSSPENGHYMTLNEDGVMTVTIAGKDHGAYAEYQWVKVGNNYYAYMTKQYNVQLTLPRIYFLSNVYDGRGQISNVHIRLINARGYVTEFDLKNPIRMESLSELHANFGASKEKMIPVDVNLSFAKKTDFTNKVASEDSKSLDTKPTPSQATPPYNLVCDLKVIKYEEGGMFRKYAKRYDVNQYLPEVNVSEFLDNIVAYSKARMGDKYREGRRGATWVEVNQFFSRAKGSAGFIYSVKGNTFEIKAALPDTAAIPVETVKQSFCDLIEALSRA